MFGEDLYKAVVAFVSARFIEWSNEVSKTTGRVFDLYHFFVLPYYYYRTFCAAVDFD